MTQEQACPSMPWSRCGDEEVTETDLEHTSAWLQADWWFKEEPRMQLSGDEEQTSLDEGAAWDEEPPDQCARETREKEYAEVSDWDWILLKALRLPGLSADMLLHELLTATEEQVLARLIQEGIAVARDEGLRRARSGRGMIERAATAADIFVRSNIRLVRSVVLRRGKGLEYDDAMSHGMLGLMRAVQKFQPGRGKFSTYAVWWIRQSLGRGSDDEARLIRIPVHQMTSIRATEHLLDAINEDWASPANKLPDSVFEHMSREKYESLHAVVAEPISLGDATSPDPGEEWWEGIPEERDTIGELDEELLRSEIWSTLERCIGWTPSLSLREYEMVRMRFGAYDGEEWTLDQIGRRFGVTRERVRQIISKVVQDPLVKEAFAGFIDDEAPLPDWSAYLEQYTKEGKSSKPAAKRKGSTRARRAARRERDTGAKASESPRRAAEERRALGRSPFVELDSREERPPDAACDPMELIERALGRSDEPKAWKETMRKLAHT